MNNIIVKVKKKRKSGGGEGVELVYCENAKKTPKKSGGAGVGRGWM